MMKSTAGLGNGFCQPSGMEKLGSPEAPTLPQVATLQAAGKQGGEASPAGIS